MGREDGGFGFLANERNGKDEKRKAGHEKSKKARCRKENKTGINQVTVQFKCIWWEGGWGLVVEDERNGKKEKQKEIQRRGAG